MGTGGRGSSSTAPSILARYSKPRAMLGSGNFACQNNTAFAKFKVVWYPDDVTIIVRGKQVNGCLASLSDHGDQWELNGELDDGRSIRAKLFRSHSTYSPSIRETMVSFIPSDNVTIGEVQTKPPYAVSYPLIGYQGEHFTLIDDGWSIGTENGEMTSEQARQIRRGWSLAPECYVLRLSHPSATVEQYADKALEVLHLLSLAGGNGVTFNRHSIFWADAVDCEIYQQMIRYRPGPGSCVPSFRVQRFLEQTLPGWRSWNQEKRDVCRLIIDYLAVSGTGYMDTRLMEIWQAWEVVATEGDEETQLSSEEEVLKDRLKQVWKDWRKQHTNADKDAHLWERVSFAFCWATALSKIEAFANSRHLNLERIGLDVKELKRARDSVAHTGKMPQDMYDDRSHALSVLRAAQFGLQLALLVDLGYSDLVETEENGWRTFVEIGKLLKQNGQDD